LTSPERVRATYAFQPVDHLPRREFYIWQEAIERWKTEGLPDDWQETNLFNYDEGSSASPNLNLGWCEPPFVPAYETKVIREEGDHEIIQDHAGRWLKVFKGRRHGFMPDYLRHVVTCEKDWEEDVAPRLAPASPERWTQLEESCATAKRLQAEQGMMVIQGMIGGYMYLRAMVGPEDLLYLFVDKPELIHVMMQRWLSLMDTAMEKIQELVELDQISLAEDICYKSSMLISPAMVREFLLPYYQEVIGNARGRQQRHIYFMVDTDGHAPSAIPLYLEAGMDVMMPFEVASDCDVVEIGRQYPNLVMSGGIDKRILAESKDAIDRHLEHIIPAMLDRGGYIPTCDHGVPDNVSFENYLHYRKRICGMDPAR
jgi:uroporphyrinogen decarboxylase